MASLLCTPPCKNGGTCSRNTVMAVGYKVTPEPNYKPTTISVIYKSLGSAVGSGWKQVYERQGENIRSVVWTGKSWLAFGNSLLKSLDNGESWTKVVSKDYRNTTSVAATTLANGKNVIITAMGAYMMYSEDDGASWEEIRFNPPKGMSACDGPGVSPCNVRYVVAAKNQFYVLFSYRTALFSYETWVISSVDGKIWTLKCRIPEMMTQISYDMDSDSWIMVGTKTYRSKDDWITYTEVKPNQFSNGVDIGLGVGCGNGKCVAVGAAATRPVGVKPPTSSSSILYLDRNLWIDVNYDDPSNPETNPNLFTEGTNVLYTGTYWVAVGDNFRLKEGGVIARNTTWGKRSSIAVSEDGYTWKPVLDVPITYQFVALGLNRDKDFCDCEPGWAGADCGTCTKSCNGRGTCSNSTGLCECQTGWGGEDCEQCTKTCNGRGPCDETGMCVCEPGWEGADCETCTRTCNGRGTCSNSTGLCECQTGWGGDDCETCTKTCVNGGPCRSDGTCACPAQKVCNGKGACDSNGVCTCQDGWTGVDCSIPPPRFACSSNGMCSAVNANVGGVSFADMTSCSSQCCPVGSNGQVCSGSGVCTNGKCVCAKGKTGQTCELQDCSVNTACGTCAGAGCAWCPSTSKCEMPSSSNANTCPVKKAQCCAAPPAAGCFSSLTYFTGCAPNAAKGIVECSSSVTNDPSQTCCLSSEVSKLSTAACPAGWTADVSKDYCQTSINPLSPKYRVKCKRVCP